MRLIVALGLLVSLAACGSAPASRDETIAMMRQAASQNDMEALRRRVDELETQLHATNRFVGKNTSSIAEHSRAYADGVAMDVETHRRLDDNDKAFHEQINYLRARQGLPPMPSK